MIAFLKRNQWSGSFNGYVAIPYEHELYGHSYNGIETPVHGGITFSEKFHKAFIRHCHPIEGNLEDLFEGDWWVIGFDCSHNGDNIKTWSKKRVKEETLFLLEWLKNYNDN